MGTGASGGNAGDGNSITSQRSRWDDDGDEMEFYTNKNVYGAEGGHYKNEPAFHNPNRQKMGMFELTMSLDVCELMDKFVPEEVFLSREITESVTVLQS